MTFIAFFIIGLVTYFALPVSLLPDIAIPEITVQVSSQNTSARELEGTVMKPLRTQIMQVSKLKSMESNAQDGSGIIRLGFDYGTNTDLAFIEVNEKIDAAMNNLPKDVNRPKVVKASATDIPVLYLNMTLKADSTVENIPSGEFLDMCEFADNVIKRRIEQLPEVAMVDITGVVEKRLRIVPDKNKQTMLGISVEDIETALTKNNVEPGSMMVRDGYYEYNIKFSNILRTVDDVKSILINRNGNIFQLGSFCDVSIEPVSEKGVSVSNGKRAVTLAVIKQADENMDKMKLAINRVVESFEKEYGNIEFSVSRNQTELLDYTIANLKQNLSLGFLFICLVAIFFLGDVRSPFIIGVSMVVSLVICFLFFYIFNMSLNIISLSGLILSLGMMIDSCIIVTENIAQYRERGLTLRRSCEVGTNEVITPMLSSSLTTIAVFIPLIFMSGIAGALFYDQAFAVTVGLLVSYVTGIILLPVLYRLIYRAGFKKKKQASGILKRFKSSRALEHFYDNGIDFIFSHKRNSIAFCAVSVPLCVVLFLFIDKEKMPKIDQNELETRIEWNENIHVNENLDRVDKLLGNVRKKTVEQSAAVGEQDYMLNRDKALSTSESELYVKTEKSSDIPALQKDIYENIKKYYPQAVVTFSPPETVFEKLFVTGEADVTAQLYWRRKDCQPTADELRDIERGLAEATGTAPVGVAFENQLNISVKSERMMLYNVDYNELLSVLKTAFKGNSVTTLRSNNQYLPVSIAGADKTVGQILQETLIQTSSSENGTVDYVPLRELVDITQSEDLKSVTACSNGEYVPLSFYELSDAPAAMRAIKRVIGKSDDWDVTFTGGFFSNKEMLDELVVILFVSILLMYFILAAQFESFVQPLIVLLEIPIDVAFALLLLMICGHTLNLMSAIGLIVTCGIIINDSILKLDAINELRKAGVPLLDAIHEAGRRRLRAIVMTSLTTIFAMVPLLFSFDMGSELQKPLAIAMIGAMFVGTLVSLFIIPLIYWHIYKGKQ
jgi:multidrug efflux pump subunit AcrB